MLATVPLCGGGFGPGDGFLAFLFLAILVAMAVKQLLPVLALAAGLVLAFKVARRLSDDGSWGEELQLVDSVGRAEVRWRGLFAARLVADDGGLRLTTPFRRPLELDADLLRAVDVVRLDRRYALVVFARGGKWLRCGRPCRQRGELERAREALRRALRLEPVRSA